ncbi:MAG: hypothetical protein GXP37_00540 [Chloroflexi bacterium]|nr:hypothetical protein [Chloroflexota bacterium]
MLINDNTAPSPPPHTDLETAIWVWLAYQCGLPLRRTKEIIMALRQGSPSLQAALASADGLDRASLSSDEKETLAQVDAGVISAQVLVRQWQDAGIRLLRQDQSAYPDTLRRHYRPLQQPLLLSTRGEVGLLDMPLILPTTGDTPDAEASDWTVTVLQELAGEGALPLLVAEPGLSVELVRRFLPQGTPFALVIPQGLATYTPPATLSSAIDGARVVLLSPFPPQQSAAASRATLSPTRSFAQALAHGLLVITPPHPQGLLPEQPCFLRPGIPKTLGCTHTYVDPEDLFMQLSEVPLAAAPYVSSSPGPEATPVSVEPPPAPLEPEDLISQLARLGHVPDVFKQRLRQPRNHEPKD